MASDSRKDIRLDDGSRNGAMDPKGVVADDSQTSDNEGGERPVRNKLKETSITSAPKTSEGSGTVENGQDGESSRGSSRGRKRSFNEDQPDKTEDDPGHRRKRSRDSSSENPNAADSMDSNEDQPGQLQDPSGNPLALKKKRSRDQLEKDYSKSEDAKEKPDPKDSLDTGKSVEKSVTEGEPEKKRHRDDSQERDPAAAPNAFANTSSVSPFGSMGTSASKPVTSASAFASSSLAAFSGSEKSPFGSLGDSSSSVFKPAATPTITEASKPALSGFATASKPSGFGALGSGFSGFSGGFGAAGSGGGLTSFASAGGPSVLGTSSSKAFGASEDDSDDGEGKQDDGDEAPGEFAADKTDERFFERTIETGEEEEKTYFSCKAKLFQFSDREWRERGVGTFKVNVKVSAGQEDKKAARLIMRADGVLRVMLNTPIFKGMTVGDASGNEPKSKQIHLASLENNRTIPILLRTGNEDHAKELYRVIQDLLKHL